MNLSAFLAENALKIESVKYVVSKRFLAENGEPIPWEIHAISSTEDENLRRACTKRVQVPGKKGQYTNETDFNLYIGKLLTACIVFPNLNDEALQDRYHVWGAEALLKAMLTAGEYANLAEKVQSVCGFDTELQDEVDEAKN